MATGTCNDQSFTFAVSVMTMLLKKQAHALALLAVSLTIALPQSHATTWRIERGVSADLNFSEQIKENNEETDQERLVGFSPFIEIAGAGKRTNLEFRALLNFRRRLDIDSTESSPTLKFESNTQLIQRVLSVNTAASLADRIVDNDALVGDSVLGFGARSRIRELSVTPVLQLPVGSDGAFTTSVRLAKVTATIDDQAAGSESSDLVSEFVQSTDKGVLASIRGGYLNTEFDSGEKSQTSTLNVGASVPISRTLLFNASGGYETLRFDAADADEDGEAWKLGFIWNPLERVTVDVNYGRRVFGANPSISVQIAGKRTLLQLSLSRDLAFSRRSSNVAALVDQDTSDISDGLGNENIDLASTEDVGTLSALSRDSRAIDEVASISYKLFGRRTVFTGLLSRYERIQLGSDEVVQSTSAELSINRRLTLKTSLSLGISERRSESEANNISESRKLRKAGIIFYYVL